MQANDNHGNRQAWRLLETIISDKRCATTMESFMSRDRLYTTHELKNYSLSAVDGYLGNFEDMYIDVPAWQARYLLPVSAITSNDRRYLISSLAIGIIDHAVKRIYVELTQHQIEHSPAIRAQQPLSRQYEIEYYSYYGWPPYWEQNSACLSDDNEQHKTGSNERHGKVVKHPMYSSLHRADQLKGFLVVSRDGISGYVEDLILDARYWLIHYLQIKVHAGSRHKHILLEPGWIEQINLPGQTIHISLPSRAITRAPAFDPARAIDPEYETCLAKHYGTPQRELSKHINKTRK
jgi:hypothetical protein